MEGSWLKYITPMMRMPLESNEAFAEASKYKSKRKPCCVCKLTKKLRDGCIRLNDDEDVCVDFIEGHKRCLRAKGFRVD